MARKPSKDPAEMPVIEDQTTPVDPIEIDLGDSGDGSAVVDLAAPATAAAAPVIEKPAPAEPDDNPLQKALDAQKRAEELQQRTMRERDEAVNRAQERERELTRERGEREDAEYNSVLTAIAAEQASADKAEMDYASAMQQQDWALAAKAQRVLSAAASRLDRLEDGKRAFETKRETKTEPAARATAALPPQNFEAKIAQFPEDAKAWLRKNPQFIEDPAQTRRAGGVHAYLVDTKGLSQFSPAYFDALETELGLKTAAPAATAAAPEPQPAPRRSMPMSAPVSRAVPSASGVRTDSKMTLTPEEREVARTSFTATDMTNAQKEYLYAQNKAKLLRQRANGQYRQTTEQNG